MGGNEQTAVDRAAVPSRCLSGCEGDRTWRLAKKRLPCHHGPIPSGLIRHNQTESSKEMTREESMKWIVLMGMLWLIGCSSPDPYTSKYVGDVCSSGCPSYLKCDAAMGRCQPPCVTGKDQGGNTIVGCNAPGWGCSKNNGTCRKKCDAECPEGTSCWPSPGGTKCTKEP